LAAISPFGCFSWIQALSGIIFGQSDRLIVGALLGSSAVAYYSVCTQAAQSIHGLAASGFHFLFPRLSARHATVAFAELRQTVKHAFLINVVLVALLCLPMAVLSKAILTLWIGAPFAATVWPILSVTAIGFGLVGMNVTAHYTLMAVGAIRYVTFLNVAAGLIMTAAMIILTSHFGLIGAAVGRLAYGPVTWLAYWKVRILLKPASEAPLLKPALTGV
jgi:O-antigen/teichoic acid export membrane protein